MRRFVLVVVLAGLGTLSTSAPLAASSYDDLPARTRAAYSLLAVVANVTPIAAAYVAPRCLPGFVVCKAFFAGFSVLAAGTQLVFSGGADMTQPRAILARGFFGDWYLTGRHVAGDRAADPYAEAAESPNANRSDPAKPFR